MRHETTIVYQKCLQLMETARERRSSSFPPGFAFLADELRRNTSSVSRSFAEGYYYDSKRQQRRYFGYAMQASFEASASLDTLDRSVLVGTRPSSAAMRWRWRW